MNYLKVRDVNSNKLTIYMSIELGNRYFFSFKKLEVVNFYT